MYLAAVWHTQIAIAFGDSQNGGNATGRVHVEEPEEEASREAASSLATNYTNHSAPTEGGVGPKLNRNNAVMLWVVVSLCFFGF